MMLELYISKKIEEKLREKHNVTVTEVEDAYDLYTGYELEDRRENNRTNPPTHWFIGETLAGRKLKIVYIPRVDLGVAILRTAYPPSKREIQVFKKMTRRKR
ncbi:MAG: ADP-ribosyl-(dinitrogen reductase) hydrolase [Oligoflexales bacterium]|nr:ADP-ribosyl-(dinitrogen reductase) hydrolase [Oligoflexales bacterium]